MARSRFLSLAIGGPLLLAASTAAIARAEPKTAASVIAADDEWLASERLGDVARLNARLADEYRDVLPDGKVHLKSQLLKAVANHKDRATGTVAEVAAAVRKQHPVIEKVVIVGDTAILSFHSVDPTLEPLVRSTDVFTYDHGMWKGLLSTHAALPPASSS